MPRTVGSCAMEYWTPASALVVAAQAEDKLTN
jgi:hypothetical protein